MIMMIWGWLYFPLTCMTQPAILNPWSKQTCNQRLQTKEKIWHSVDNWLMKRRMKSHLHEPAKSGGVVVPDGLRIAKRLEDRVCLKDLLLHPRWDVCRHAGGCSFGDGSNLVPPSILSIVWPFQDKKTLVTFATYQMGQAVYIDKKMFGKTAALGRGLTPLGLLWHSAVVAYLQRAGALALCFVWLRQCVVRWIRYCAVPALCALAIGFVLLQRQSWLVPGCPQESQLSSSGCNLY